MGRHLLSVPATLAVILLAVAGCGGDETADAGAAPAASAEPEGDGTADQRFPDVVAAELTPEGDTWTLDVTIASPYDSPGRYADGWRVLDPDGTVLGETELGHDHADEQPFTRTQTGLEIPDGVEQIVIEGHDLENGYGGGTVSVDVA